MSPLFNRVKTCDKCMTVLSKCYEYNGRWLCKANVCYQEEIEKDSGKWERDEANLDLYKDLVARTFPQTPSTY